MKKFLSMVLALVMTMSLVTISAGAKSFTDDSKITYKEAVDVVSELKIVDGYADGAFNPQNTLTRGAAAKIICNLILGPTTASALSADAAPFKDVPASHEFAGYIAYCAQQGIINGYADGTFRPAGTLNGYAFMKMLLGALGYDGSVEKYTGPNWSVNVAKQALGLGLDDGNSEFVGANAVTREEACLYAFNTLQATMVEYENTNSIVIGDVTVNTSSKAKEMENSLTADNTIKKDGKMQFAEKYFDNLKKEAGDSDEFERPATTWKIKSSAIGTYSDTPDVSYTESVKMGDVYKDLGLSSSLKVADVEVFENGAKATSYGITKGDTSNELGGNGVLTEVFYDEDNDTARITLINTYLGEITGTHKASGSKDAYVTVAAKADSVSAGGNFETDESFDVDDLVLYTYSNKAGDKGVQSVSTAVEKVEGTLSSFTSSKNVSVGGTTYKANAANKADINSDKLTNAVDQDVTIYLDEYGYVLFVDTDAASGNYAVVLSHDMDTVYGGRAKLLFTDGSTAVVSLRGTYTYDDSADNAGLGKGDIVRYTVNGSKEYRLEVIADFTNSSTGDGSKKLVTKGTSSLSDSAFDAANKYVVTSRDSADYANGKTTFLIATTNNSDETVYNVYEGIKNVPDVVVADTKTVPVATYVKSGNAATLIYIDATSNATISGSSKDVIFVKGNSSHSATRGSSYSSELGTYWEYDAIVNGEFTKVKSDNYVNAYKLYDNVSYSKDGQIVSLSSGTGTTVDTVIGANGVFYVNGTDRVKNDVIGLGSGYYTYTRDCQVFRLNEDGDIEETVYTVSNIAADDNDKVWFKMDDGDVTTVVIQDVADGAASSTPGTEIIGTDTSSSAETKDALKGETDGAYTFPSTATALEADCGDIRGGIENNIFFKFQTDVANQTAILRIYDADGNRMYYEAYKFADAGPHLFYVQILGTGLINAGSGPMKDAPLTVGDYTWEVTSGSDTLASGFFTVEA